MPAHDEEDWLRAAVAEVSAGLRDRSQPFELVIVENGSNDTTLEVARGLESEYPEVRALSLDQADYGLALRAGFLAATGDVVAIFDVDYFDLDFLGRALAVVNERGGPAIVVASKRGADAVDNRAPLRRLVTSVFALVLRAGFGLGVSDTHGMKVLRRQPLVELARACRFGTDLFDTELVLRAEREGLRAVEIGVTVEERRPSRSSILRRIPRTVGGLVRLRVALWRERI
ncbi:MAG: glycosyltransferase [Acidimicrobiales bacterium]